MLHQSFINLIHSSSLTRIGFNCFNLSGSFDLVILGLGDDGHTASLFPYKDNNDSDDLVIYSYGKGIKRISLTPKVLSNSKKVVFLVSGSSKRMALKRLIESNESVERTPAKLIKPNSQILVFSDLEASNS